jgi:putative tricarboxylic transport membrane protein
MKDIDRAGGFFFLLVGGYAVAESLRLPLGGFRHPDAGFLPFGLGIALVFLSALLLIRTCRKTHQGEWLLWGEGKYRVGVAAASMLCYVFVLNCLGYMIATCLIMIVILRLLERLRWLTALLVTVPSVLISYIAFSFYLGVPLPKGLIPF